MPEFPKDHENIPDSTGLGDVEVRSGDGSLMIFFEGSPTTKQAAYVILGKWLTPQHDGAEFYVTDKTKARGFGNAPVSRHEHLLMALAKIAEIREAYYAGE